MLLRNARAVAAKQQPANGTAANGAAAQHNGALGTGAQGGAAKGGAAGDRWQWWETDYSNHIFKDVTPAPDSLINMLSSAVNYSTGSGLTDRQIAAQSNTMIAAGYETTAATLSFAVYLLARNPAAAAKLVEEIDENCDGDGDISMPDLARFPYSEAVINETLRMMPAAVFVTREATVDATVGGIFIPKGTYIGIPIYAMHYNERFFHEPATFRPERFLSPTEVARMQHAFVPFGMGPRMCIGLKLALEEARIALIRMYQRFTFHLDPTRNQVPLPVKIGITMSARDGVWVVPVPRGAGRVPAAA